MTFWKVVVEGLLGAAIALGVGAIVRAHRPADPVDPLPEPPRNVRVIKADGTVIPVECAYRGRDEDGLHLWVSVSAIQFFPWAGDSIACDMLPGRSSITIQSTAG